MSFETISYKDVPYHQQSIGDIPKNQTGSSCKNLWIEWQKYIKTMQNTRALTRKEGAQKLEYLLPESLAKSILYLYRQWTKTNIGQHLNHVNDNIIWLQAYLKSNCQFRDLWEEIKETTKSWKFFCKLLIIPLILIFF